MKHSVVFFGTHEFAASILTGLLESPDFEVVMVVTQTDKPVGRKQIMTAPPVKILAESKGIPYVQPESLKNFELPSLQPDFGIVAQYGKIIPQRLLDWPKFGMINTHTSLLPKYRGASPVQAALLAGDTKTGITIMRMDAGMDTGPILLQEAIAIAPDDRAPDVEKKLAKIAVPNLLRGAKGLADGTITATEQNNALATLCGKLDRSMGQINWHESAAKIYNIFRALYPWPGIWTTWNGKRIKLLEIKPNFAPLAAGKIQTTREQILVGTTTTALEILSLQMGGKNAMSAKEFLAGNALDNTEFGV